MPPPSLTERLKTEARRLGIHDVGIARPAPSDHGVFLRRWLDAGMAGEMAYLGRDEAVARRMDPSRSLEGVRSVVVAADHYPPEDPPGVPGDRSVGVIARYARGRDYHKVLEAKLRALGRWLDEAAEGEGGEGPPRASESDGGGGGRRDRHRTWVDTGPLLERELGRRAGLGWFGRNTMLIHPRRGSYFFLGVLLTTVELEADPPFEADRCGSCTACLDACPTGALLGRDEDGAPVLDATLCISYLTIEHGGPIPIELRPAMGNRVFGCDICQEVCPWNRSAAEATEPGYAARGPGERPTGVQPVSGVEAEGGRSREPEHRSPPPEPPAVDRAIPWHPGTKAPSLVDLMRMTRDDWEAFTRGSAIRRAGYAGFKRNVAVALGNWLAGLEGEPPEEAVALLREALNDEEPLVREHVGWALEREG